MFPAPLFTPLASPVGAGGVVNTPDRVDNVPNNTGNSGSPTDVDPDSLSTSPDLRNNQSPSDGNNTSGAEEAPKLKMGGKAAHPTLSTVTILNLGVFTDARSMALADLIEGSLMLKYNNEKRKAEKLITT